MPCAVAAFVGVDGSIGSRAVLKTVGCALHEASDAKPIFKLVSEWQIEATPVLEDSGAGQTMGRLYG